MQHQAIILRRLVKVCAFATSEDAADAAVSRTAKHVVVVMHAATQASVATNVVRVLEMSKPNHNVIVYCGMMCQKLDWRAHRRFCHNAGELRK